MTSQILLMKLSISCFILGTSNILFCCHDQLASSTGARNGTKSTVDISLWQGSATPGTRATGGTREDFLWHAK